MGFLWIFVTLFIAGSLYFFNTKVTVPVNSVTGDVKSVNKKKKKKGKNKNGEATVVTEVDVAVKTKNDGKGKGKGKGKDKDKDKEKDKDKDKEKVKEKTKTKSKSKGESKTTLPSQEPQGKPSKSTTQETKLKVEPVVEISKKPTQTTEPKKNKKGTSTQTPLTSEKVKSSDSSSQKGNLASNSEKTSTKPEQESPTTVRPVPVESKEDSWYKEEVEKPPARVMKIKGPKPESGSEEEPAEEGWVKIKRTVHSPKIPSQTPTNIELLEAKTVTGQSILTKTQRKNARRALKRKEERESFQHQQELRLRQHRRDLMNARINSKDYAPKIEPSRWNVPGASDEDVHSQGSSENAGLIWDV